MKAAIVLWYQRKTRMGLDAKPVAFVHDELQMDCAKKDAKAAGQLFVDCLEDVGRKFKTNIPITGEYLIGASWADAH